MNSVVNVAKIRPPITALPRGVLASLPRARPNAIGTRAKNAATAVITTGRTRTEAALIIASVGFSVATPSILMLPSLTRPSIALEGLVSSTCDSPVRNASVVLASEQTQTRVADSPASPDAMTYTVKPGDSAIRIAREFGVDVETLLVANRVANRNCV